MYERAIARKDPRARVFGQACPEFVEFVERGEVEGDHIYEVALGYLEPMKQWGMDTLIMGCTHYPLLAGLLQDIMGPEVALISSADETAAEVEDILDRLGWLAGGDVAGEHRFLTTGDVEKSTGLGRMFLGPEVESAIHVDLKTHPDLGMYREVR
jgi:glutamate racemase